MCKPFLFGLVLVIFAFPAAAQQNSQGEKQAIGNTIPADAAQKANPVKPSTESIARGKKQYGYDCAMCHGKAGDGKGDVAADMKLGMMDFTNPATLKERSDGELYYIIKNGRGQMPPEGDRGQPKLLWDMVNYLRWLSNQKSDLPKEEKPADDADKK